MRKISKTAREIWDEQMETREMALSGEGEYNWWRSRLSKPFGSSIEYPRSEPR